MGIDHVINPHTDIVDTIQNSMEIPGESEVIEFVGGRVKLIGFFVTDDSPFVDRQLLSFNELKGRILVGAIFFRTAGGKIWAPPPELEPKPQAFRR